MTDVTQKVENAIARFERVTRQLDQRGGPAQEASRRERRRLNAGVGRTVIRVAIAVALIWLATIIFGFVAPIGMFGFLTALLVTGIVAAVLIASGRRRAIGAPAPSTDLPNGAMVERFDSYIYRSRAALPAPAQAELDAISRILPSLKQTLSRLETLDPAAQDARRLMSIHLPGLIDRYERVPPAFREERAAPHSSMCPSSLPAPMLPPSRPRAVSFNRATATSLSPARTRQAHKLARGRGAAHDNEGITWAGADGDGACLAQCWPGAERRAAAAAVRPSVQYTHLSSVHRAVDGRFCACAGGPSGRALRALSGAWEQQPAALG